MKHIRSIQICLILAAALTSCVRSKNSNSAFTFEGGPQGIELRENGNPVFFYQREPKKSTTGDYVITNYLHPLYGLDGDTLTEEFPADHPYHAGIFWTWHQLFQDDRNLGDGWIMDGISKEVINASTKVENSEAILSLDVLWKSKILGDDHPFMDEFTTITVHPSDNNIRKIDFVIILKALVPGFNLGGSDDEKGYGGLCARIKLPESLTFTSDSGQVTPIVTQIVAGPWMDFSGDFGAKNGERSGLAILCHPDTPNYPAPWILRQVTSMQNIVYPGRDRVSIPMSEPVILHYRLIVHKGDAESVDFDALQKEYNAIKY